MFREILTELIKDNEWAKLQKPCDESELAKAEKYVGYSLPNELKHSLGKQTEINGFAFGQGNNRKC